MPRLLPVSGGYFLDLWQLIFRADCPATAGVSSPVRSDLCESLPVRCCNVRSSWRYTVGIPNVAGVFAGHARVFRTPLDLPSYAL